MLLELHDHVIAFYHLILAKQEIKNKINVRTSYRKTKGPICHLYLLPFHIYDYRSWSWTEAPLLTFIVLDPLDLAGFPLTLFWVLSGWPQSCIGAVEQAILKICFGGDVKIDIDLRFSKVPVFLSSWIWGIFIWDDFFEEFWWFFCLLCPMGSKRYVWSSFCLLFRTTPEIRYRLYCRDSRLRALTFAFRGICLCTSEKNC